MRVKKFHKFGFLLVLFLLLTLKSVYSLGVGQPMPVGFKLLRNDQGRFYFRISAANSITDLTCTYSISDVEPLLVTFDENEVILESGGNKLVYGTILVPADAPIKNYIGTLLVTCEPEVEGISGSKLIQSWTMPFEMSVVSTLEEKETGPSTPEKKPTTTISTSAIFAIIIIVILVIGVGYWLGKRSKKK